MASNVNQDASARQPASKPQKLLTKAERRELQEKQRAAKAAAAGSGGAAASSTAHPKSTKSTPPASTPTAKKIPPSIAVPTPTRDRDRDRDTAGSMGDAQESGAHGKTRGIRIFSHFGIPKPVSHIVKGDVHPTIVRLALQFSSFKICGANARCIATLTAFKAVIQDYKTPPNNTLSRHLMTHLSPQITHLVNARPMSVTMGNAIRQLKLDISGSDIDLPEQDAKDALCQKIDDYIRDKIIIADEVIQDIAGKKIKDGDIVLTYGRSSVVEKVLLGAHEEGKKFEVVIVDSRPLLEGKFLLTKLSRAGIPCTYLHLPALPSYLSMATTPITTVFLGAHSLHSNGAVFSRAGTALVSMIASERYIPVVVCCETYKFSEGVMLDGFMRNELAPGQQTRQPNLEVLNPLYDLTPPRSITAVVTEVGIIPPSSISSIPAALGKQML